MPEDLNTNEKKKHSPLRRVISAAISLVIVAAIFIYAIPRIADYSAVWATVSTLTPIEFWTLFAAMVFNLFTYWLANMAALPGLRLGPAAVVTQTTTSVANTIPAGGAVAVGLTYTILSSWGFNAQAITLYIGVTGVWNTLMKLALPVVVARAPRDHGPGGSRPRGRRVDRARGAAVAVSLFSLALWKKEFARRIGDGIGRVRVVVPAARSTRARSRRGATRPSRSASGRSSWSASAGSC